MMKRLGRLHFWNIGLGPFNGSRSHWDHDVCGCSGNEPVNRQAMMGQPADHNTTESDDNEKPANSSAATDDSTAETASIDTQGNMGTTPQGGLMVLECKERCQAVAVSKAETLLQGNLSTFIKGQAAWLHPPSSLSLEALD
ncbi:hypothetical protein J7E95_15130 [Streptomyces sp. ISL-14]|nr:hypothetical protein [Streptomyces sp. ISL-14]